MTVGAPITERWPSVRGRFLFREVNERGFDLPLASVTRDGGVEFRADLDISVWNPGSDTSGYKRVRPGDFVIGLRSFQSGIGYSPIEGLVSPAYTVLRPTDQSVARPYFKHLFKSDVYISRLENVAQGIRQGRTISTEDFYGIPVPLPPVDIQRAIADYLDAETARIDALIAKKRRFIELLEDRRWSYFLRLVRVANAPVVPLRRALLGITDGPFGSAFSSSEYTDDGIAVVRLGNIGFAEWRGGDLAHLPESRYRDFLRHRVQPGDVLFAGLGDDRNHAGRACVAPEGGRMIVKGKCFCGRINRRRAIPDFLAMFCSSPDGASAIAVEARGSTRTMINLDIIKGVPVPLPSLDQQRSIVHETRSSWAATRSCIDRLDRQLDMLVEHRQALITAAVTGDLEVAA